MNTVLEWKETKISDTGFYSQVKKDWDRWYYSNFHCISMKNLGTMLENCRTTKVQNFLQRATCCSENLSSHVLQPTRLNSPSLSPTVCSNSCRVSGSIYSFLHALLYLKVYSWYTCWERCTPRPPTPCHLVLSKSLLIKVKKESENLG